MACSFKPKRYVVRFEGNNSKKWDGKEVWLDAEVLDELYSENELVHGCTITVPWKSKKNITHWNAIFINPSVPRPPKANAESVTSQAVTPQAETTVQQPTTNAASKKGTSQKKSQTKKTSKRPAKRDDKPSGTVLQVGNIPNTTTIKGGESNPVLSQLVEQQSQIISLLTNMVKHTIPTLAPTQMVAQSQQVAQAPTQMVAQSQQVAHVPTQMASQAQVAEANRCSTPTIMELLETTDEELDFINSPSWQSVLSSDKESTSTAAQTPSVNPSLAAYPVTPPMAVDPPVPTRLSVTQLSNPSTPWGTSAHPPAPSNLLTPADLVTQPTSTYSVTPPTQMGSFSMTQSSLPSTPWGMSAHPPSGPSNPADSFTQMTQPMLVNPLAQMSSFSMTQPSLPSAPWGTSAHPPSAPADSVTQVTQPMSANQATILPPPFNTPPKLLPVEQVMSDYPGNDVASLRRLTTALAREAIFGRDSLSRSSLSGKNKTGSLDKQKLDYIKAVVRSRVPTMPAIQFEGIWDKCRSSLSKSCQTLRTTAKKKILG